MLQGMLARIKAKRDKLLDLYSDGLFSKDDLNKKVSDLNDQESTIKYQLAKIQEAETFRPDLVPDAIVPIITTLAEFPFWTPKQKRAFMKSQLPEITVTNEGVSGVLLGVPTPRNRMDADLSRPKSHTSSRSSQQSGRDLVDKPPYAESCKIFLNGPVKQDRDPGG